MDALTKLAWRAFWIGLGASIVLVGQSVVGHPSPPSMAPEMTIDAVSAPPPANVGQPSVERLRRAS